MLKRKAQKQREGKLSSGSEQMKEKLSTRSHQVLPKKSSLASL